MIYRARHVRIKHRIATSNGVRWRSNGVRWRSNGVIRMALDGVKNGTAGIILLSRRLERAARSQQREIHRPVASEEPCDGVELMNEMEGVFVKDPEQIRPQKFRIAFDREG